MDAAVEYGVGDLARLERDDYQRFCGLYFSCERAHMRHANWIRHAVDATLSDQFGDGQSERSALDVDWFLAMTDTKEEGVYRWQKYLANRRMSRTPGR